MTVTIRITAQYYENYSDTNVPYWKPKGGREFLIEGVDDDVVMYADDLVAVLTDVVANESDEHNKYEYLEHVVDFFKPINIDSKIVSDAIRKQYKLRHA